MINILILLTALVGVAVCITAMGWIGTVERRLTELESGDQPD